MLSIKIILWLLSVILIPFVFTKRKGEFSWAGVVLGTIIGILVLLIS